MSKLSRLHCAVLAVLAGTCSVASQAEIAATHVWHNHMPNFWPYFNVSSYDSLAVGAPIRYSYDGQVKNLKLNPPAGWPMLPNGKPMPHDDLESYYAHHAKTGAYLSWPMDTVESNLPRYPLSQAHVTMSAAVINNVQSFGELNNQAGYNLGWGDRWRSVYSAKKTSNGKKALDLIHFTGHHSMGPLVGNDYFLKDLIYHNATLAQPYFLGDSFVSSKGFFPTELGFSDRLIPTLKKLGIEWSVLGNVHYSRTLRDYPYLNDPGIDCLISPPNRADLRNVSAEGDWVKLNMTNEQQVTYNKFPFASTPHWVEYIDPETGASSKVAGIPVEQASSWAEGYLGEAKADPLKPFVAAAAAKGRTQYFVLAHDGDNSSGRAGSGDTWLASGNVTYADAGVTGMGIDEYLAKHPIPEDDVVHVQDGSWIDTRDSSSDPTWNHWRIPMGVWSGQLDAFNAANGTSYTKMYSKFTNNLRSHMPSMEFGYHYLERNFALLQAAQNYAKTAEQIWLDANPNHWQPTTAKDKQVTYAGNQLNPWMISYPVKGDPNNDWKGGANPAELGWYFLIASIDSGFGYYDENQDDGVKPTISFNQSLAFTEPYVAARLDKDRTGPSVWWPQRYPYNPGSANASKAEGWAKMYMDNKFAIYTYAYDLSGISNIKVKVRVHTNKWADAKDKTYKLYDPAAHAGKPNVDPSRVGKWQEYSMVERNLTPVMNGVAWQPTSTAVFEKVPAKKIGNLYYTYLDQYRDQLLDYYIEATDAKGNVTKSEIQQVYVGAGRYKKVDGKYIEDVNGDLEGEPAFFSDKPVQKNVTVYVKGDGNTGSTLTVATKTAEGEWTTKTIDEVSSGSGYFDLTGSYDDGTEGLRVRFMSGTGQWLPSDDGVVLQSGTWTLKGDGTTVAGYPTDLKMTSTIFYKSTAWTQVCIHWRPKAGTWTTAPGVKMTAVDGYTGWWSYTADLGATTSAEVTFNNCSGAWDSNGGSNYQIAAGSWLVEAGKVTAGKLGNQAPVAKVSPAASTIAVGGSVTFSAIDSTDSDGTIASYKWSDGSTGSSLTKSFDTAGTYNITVTVTDDKGATNTAAAVVTVQDDNKAPVAKLVASKTTVNVGETVTLDASTSTDSDGTIASYLWSTGAKVAKTSTSFATAGVYTVSVTVTDNKGATNVASTKITVKDVVPVPTSVALQLASTTIAQNEKLALAAVVKDQNGTVMSGQTVTYYSNGVALASNSFSSAVAGNYLITAKVGAATSAAVTVKVQDATPVPSTVALQVAKTVIKPSEMLPLAALIKDQNGNTMTGQTVVYFRDNVQLTSNYLRTTRVGTYTITAKVGTVVSAGVKVTVTDDTTPVPTTVALQVAKTEIAISEKLDLAALVKDQNGNVMSGQTVVFYRNGVALTSNYLRTTRAGTYAITAKVGELVSAPVQVEVKAPSVASSVVITPTKTTAYAGENVYFYAVVKDQYGKVMSGVVPTYYRGNVLLSTNRFRTSLPGTYSFTAVVDSVTSVAVKVVIKPAV